MSNIQNRNIMLYGTIALILGIVTVIPMAYFTSGVKENENLTVIFDNSFVFTGKPDTYGNATIIFDNATTAKAVAISYGNPKGILPDGSTIDFNYYDPKAQYCTIIFDNETTVKAIVHTYGEARIIFDNNTVTKTTTLLYYTR